MTIGPDSEPATPLHAWVALALLVLLSALSYLDRQIISLLVDPMKRDLAISDLQVSLLQGIAFAFFYCVFALPAGRLVDTRSRRLIIYCGVTAWSIGAVGCGLARNYEQLLVMRFLVGAGEACLVPAGASMIADLFPRHRLSLAFGILGVGATLGNAASFGIGGLIMSLLEGKVIELPLLGLMHHWQIVFIMTGLPGFFLAFLIFAIREPVRRGPQKPSPQSVSALFDYLRNNARFFVGLILGASLMAMSSFASASWIAAALIRHYGLSIAEVGPLVMIALGTSGMIGFLLCGAFVDWLYRRGIKDAHLRYFMWAVPVGSAILAAGALSPNAIVFLAALAIAQIVLSFNGVTSAALQIMTPGEFRGQMAALYLFITGLIGMGGGPPAIALITQYGFGDPAKVHLSIAALYICTAPIIVTFFWFASKPLRAATT